MPAVERKQLTNTQIEKARPKEKDYFLRDLDGLSLRISTKGMKSWQVRLFIGGKERRLTIGEYPVMSLQEARRQRDEIKMKARTGKTVKQQNETFVSIAEAWFVEKAKSVTPGHARILKQRLDQYILPELGARAIKTIFGGKAEGTRIISCHIGSGASLCAIKDGKCVATSMGLTPLGGVMMGTRSGDLDPSVVDYLCNQTGKSVDEIYDILNKKSGLLGVSGISNDTRDVEKAAAEGNERAILTIKLYARRVADYIGQYFVRLGGADLIIFSAGVGENGPIYRETILKDVEEALNLKVDYKLNVEKNGQEAIISKPESKIKVAIIPTDEEIMIARDCYKAIEGTL